MLVCDEALGMCHRAEKRTLSFNKFWDVEETSVLCSDIFRWRLVGSRAQCRGANASPKMG